MVKQLQSEQSCSLISRTRAGLYALSVTCCNVEPCSVLFYSLSNRNKMIATSTLRIQSIPKRKGRKKTAEEFFAVASCLLYSTLFCLVDRIAFICGCLTDMHNSCASGRDFECSNGYEESLSVTGMCQRIS